MYYVYVCMYTGIHTSFVLFADTGREVVVGSRRGDFL